MELRFNPIMYSFRTTLSCNLRCGYCWQNQKGLLNQVEYSDTEYAKAILSVIRQSSSAILLTGGEPLMRHDIVDLARFAKLNLKFQKIYLITNGALLHLFEEVLDFIDYLFVSIDSLRVEAYSKRLGVKSEVVQAMISNTVRFSRIQKARNFRMSVNAVVDADSIDEANDIIKFCSLNNLRIGINPRRHILAGTYDQRLRNNPEYIRLINKVIGLKKQGRLAAPSLAYLETIRDFRSFDCNPLLFMAIMPTGELVYPCGVDGRKIANIVELGSCEKAIEAGWENVGSIREFKKNSRLCKDECFCPTYTVPALFLKKPLSAFQYLLGSRKSCGAD